MKKIKARDIKKNTEIRDPNRSRGYRKVIDVQFGTAERWLPPNAVAVSLDKTRDWVILHTNQTIYSRKPEKEDQL